MGQGRAVYWISLSSATKWNLFKHFFFNRLIADVWEILGKITALLEETKILRGQGKADCETGKYFHSYVMLYINSA